jgi:predicted NBD/HSP70 family sugar kinase
MTDMAEVVLLDFSGKMRAARTIASPGMMRDAIFDGVLDFIEDDARKAGFPREAIFGLGLAVAGFFVGEGARMNPAAPLDDWALRDLDVLATRHTGLDADVENIASAAAVGEQLLGVGRWAKSFAYLNVSHGLGAGLILNGELHRGSHGNAGEVGGMLTVYGKLPVPKLDSLQQALEVAGVPTSSITDLVTRYRDDWPGIAGWVDWATPSFAFLASMFARTLDCDAIVIGGRLPQSLARRIAESVHLRLERPRPRRDSGLLEPRIVAAEVTAMSAAIGAATMPLVRGYF